MNVSKRATKEKENTMIKHSVKTTTSKDDFTIIVRNSWEKDGYELLIIFKDDKILSFSIHNPVDAVELTIDQFSSDKIVSVNWDAIGSVSPNAARDYAFGIVEAAELAEEFQKVVDIFK